MRSPMIRGKKVKGKSSPKVHCIVEKLVAVSPLAITQRGIYMCRGVTPEEFRHQSLLSRRTLFPTLAPRRHQNLRYIHPISSRSHGIF
jgi:hypothetical protein